MKFAILLFLIFLKSLPSLSISRIRLKQIPFPVIETEQSLERNLISISSPQTNPMQQDAMSQNPSKIKLETKQTNKDIINRQERSLKRFARLAKKEFRKKLNRKMQETFSQTSPQKINQFPVGTAVINTVENLHEIIQGTIGAFGDKQPQIIVINQPIPIGLNGFNTPQFNEMSTYTSGKYPPVSGLIKGAMTHFEIDPMIVLLNRIRDIYNGYYTLLPDRVNSWALVMTDNQSTNLMAFYKKMKTFNDNFISTKDELENSMLFSISRLLTFESGEERMFKFFGMYTNFVTLANRAAPFMEVEPKFESLDQQIEETEMVYNNLASAILAETAEYQRLYEYLDQEIQNLVNVQQTNALLNAIDKFNLLLRFVVKVSEMETDLMNALEILKSKLAALKNVSKDLLNILNSYQSLVVAREQKQIQDLKTSEAYLAKLRALNSVGLFGIGIIICLSIGWF